MTSGTPAPCRRARRNGKDEECAGAIAASERWEQLDARGIEAVILELVAGERRRLVW